MNVLSLFDGMSGTQLALDRLGVKVNNYFSSEIDKWAIQVTQKNYPNTIQLGNINNWIDWHLPEIDLIVGGSPCQGFSNAGKGLNFSDSRSKLFFKFVDCLKWYKPKYFLLENVRMKQEWKDIISSYVGVEPTEINSSLVSAQSRKRLYWTNISNVKQPEDRYIYLKDILECKTSEYVKVSKKGAYKKHQNKASTLTGGGHSGGNHSDMDLIGRPIELVHAQDIDGHDFIKRIYSIYGKCPTVTAISGGNQHRKIALDEFQYRRLTPIECERLQTVPDNYTDGVSNTQRYRMLGNGFTVDVIVYILENMK